MKKFKLLNSQTHWAIGIDYIEANNLEEAQAIVLQGEGLKIEEIKSDPERS